MRVSLVQRSHRGDTVDGLRRLRFRWRWAPDCGAAARELARSRIASWLSYNGFTMHAFLDVGTSSVHLYIKADEDLLRWARPIARAVSLFLGADLVGPLRFGVTG